MLETASYIFLSYADLNPAPEAKEHWIVILIIIAKKIKECASKIELLE
jgi:hypothetical protein